MKTANREKYWEYFILVARMLLAWTFLDYGLSKFTGNQFGISEAEMATPVKDLSLFKLAWHLSDQQPFKAFIGVSQVLCAGLLIWNRTALIGTFLFLPIAINILIFDLTYMSSHLAYGFAWRFGFYFLLAFLILWHHKERLHQLWTALQSNLKAKFKFPLIAYLALPVMAIILGLIGNLPRFLFSLAMYPEQTFQFLTSLPGYLEKFLEANFLML